MDSRFPWKAVAAGGAVLGSLGILTLLARRGGSGSAATNPLAATALAELEDWKSIDESTPAGQARINEYWAVLNQSQPYDVPWSGAFISWAVDHVYPGALTLSGAHIYYTRAAYHARNTPGRYGAYQPHEIAVAPGDIVVGSRGDQVTTWQDVVQDTGMRTTHGDIVVRVEPGRAFVVGGNVGNRVAGHYISLSPEGTITKPNIFAVLRKL